MLIVHNSGVIVLNFFVYFRKTGFEQEMEFFMTFYGHGWAVKTATTLTLLRNNWFFNLPAGSVAGADDKWK